MYQLKKGDILDNRIEWNERTSHTRYDTFHYISSFSFSFRHLFRSRWNESSQSFRTFFRIEFQSCNQVNDVWNSVRIDIV